MPYNKSQEVNMKGFAAVLLSLLVLGGGLGGIVFAADQELTGAGATFPYPLYSKMFDVYSKEYGVKVNYQAIGSGGGIRQLTNKTVDFGGSDAIMKDEDIKAAGAPVLHVPICAGAVVLTYNLPGDPGVKFTPEMVADIFLGKIRKWNDQRIAQQNQGTVLPAMDITVVHRSDGSGTTNIFSDYLSKVSAEWKEKVGAGTALNWPVGLGAKGNPGVSGLVRQTPGSIGYVELIYALQNKEAYGTIQNKKGKFVKPSLTATSMAANIVLPDDMKVSLTDSSAPEGYPISGFTWIILYGDQKYGDRTEQKTRELVKLVWWMTHEGQKYAEPLQYSPLSKPAVDKAEKLIKSITYGGKALMK
jgi:phosphate transport system substrate-binding protein